MPHARLRREVNDAVQILAAIDRGEDGLAIGDVEPAEGKAGIGFEPRQTRPLQTRVVIVVEIVDADDLLATPKQRLGDMKADETGSTSDKNRHRACA